MNLQKRNSALDILRIAALFSVIGVHFFLHIGYYYTYMQGGRMLLMTMMRTGLMICVPLFVMLTGYLMCKKTLSGKYYKGIIKTIVVYLFASVACILYNKFTLGQDIGIKKAIFSVFDYTGANYAWYIEMYIGLFLLIPFLNLIYNGLTTKKGKLVLVGTLVLMSSLPASLNIYTKVLPDWWSDLYPVTYYFLGAYLREYPLKLKKWLNILLIVVTTAAFGVFNYAFCHGQLFKWGAYSDHFAFPILIVTVLTFAFFAVRDTSRFPMWSRRVLAVVSDACLGAYLFSYIFDSALYAKLNAKIPYAIDRLLWFVPMTLAVFVLSVAVSIVVNLIYKGIVRLVNFIKDKINHF